MEAEVKKVNTERGTALQGVRADFYRKVALVEEKHEEFAAIRGQFELEAITTKIPVILDVTDIFGSLRTSDDSRSGDGEQESTYLGPREHRPHSLKEGG